MEMIKMLTILYLGFTLCELKQKSNTTPNLITRCYNSPELMYSIQRMRPKCDPVVITWVLTWAQLTQWLVHHE